MAAPVPPPADSPTAAPKPAMSNMWQRILSGVVGGALLLGSIWYSGWTFALLFGLIQALMLREFYRMMKEQGFKPAAFIGVGVSLLIFAAAYNYYSSGLFKVGYEVSPRSYLDGTVPPYHTSGTSYMYHGFLSDGIVTDDDMLGFYIAKIVGASSLIALFLLPIILLLREMYWWPRDEQPFSPFANIGVALLGLFYVTLPMSGLNVLAFTDNGYDYRRIFALLFMVWAADTGAYIAGKNFGRNKLAPSISPGKTWEGWIGGFLLTLGVGWALGYLIPELPLAHRLVAAVVVSVFGVLGDLAESMLKRSVGMKDSGSIMPGHGGLLDRFDAFLFVVPVLVVLQLLFGAL